MRIIFGGVVALALLVLPAAPVRAQGAAFQPIPGQFNDGATLNVQPVVTADRRYVRMTLNPQFNALSGFDNFSVPLAVGGGGNGGLGGGGGLGGLGGGGFGGGGVGGGIGGGIGGGAVGGGVGVGGFPVGYRGYGGYGYPAYGGGYGYPAYGAGYGYGMGYGNGYVVPPAGRTVNNLNGLAGAIRQTTKKRRTR